MVSHCDPIPRTTDAARALRLDHPYGRPPARAVGAGRHILSRKLGFPDPAGRADDPDDPGASVAGVADRGGGAGLVGAGGNAGLCHRGLRLREHRPAHPRKPRQGRRDGGIQQPVQRFRVLGGSDRGRDAIPLQGDHHHVGLDGHAADHVHRHVDPGTRAAVLPRGGPAVEIRRPGTRFHRAATGAGHDRVHCSFVRRLLSRSPYMTRRTLYILLAAGGSAALMLAALGFQHLGGMAPCELCIWQRWPHVIAIGIGGLALILRAGWLAWAGALATLGTAGIGFYHTGVERGWWQGPSTCTATDATGLSTDDLFDQIMNAPLVRCDEVPWEMLGLSMASWNTVAALALAMTQRTASASAATVFQLAMLRPSISHGTSSQRTSGAFMI